MEWTHTWDTRWMLNDMDACKHEVCTWDKGDLFRNTRGEFLFGRTGDPDPIVVRPVWGDMDMGMGMGTGMIIHVCGDLDGLTHRGGAGQH
jgi:hypothetical protein